MESHPSSKPRCEVDCQPLHQLLTVVGATAAMLLDLDDPPPDFPIGCRHDRIHGPDGCATSGLHQRYDIPQQAGVIGRGQHDNVR